MLNSTLTNHFAQGRRTTSAPAAFATFATYARAVAARIRNPRKKDPPSKPKPVISLSSPQPDERLRDRRMEGPDAREERVPLSVAVSDCVRRWFKDTLKLANSGDTSAQILVAQMYRTGYGTAKSKREFFRQKYGSRKHHNIDLQL